MLVRRLLERIIIRFFESELGKYVKLGEDKKKSLHLCITKGNFVLQDLELQPDAFEEFDLPVVIQKGSVGKIAVKLKWSKLFREPIEVFLEHLQLFATPRTQNDADFLARSKDRSKRAKLDADDVFRKFRMNDASSSGSSSDPFKFLSGSGSKVRSWLLRVLRNVTVTVRDVAICYEDNFTNPQRPFVLGIYLKSLQNVSADSMFNETVVGAFDGTIYRIAKIEQLGIFWNADKCFKSVFHLSDNEFDNYVSTRHMSQDLSAEYESTMSEDNNLLANSYMKMDDRRWILHPLSARLEFRMNLQEATRTVELGWHMRVENIKFEVDATQLHDAQTLQSFLKDSQWFVQMRSIRPTHRPPIKYLPSGDISPRWIADSGATARWWWRYLGSTLIWKLRKRHAINQVSWRGVTMRRERRREYIKLRKALILNELLGNEREVEKLQRECEKIEREKIEKEKPPGKGSRNDSSSEWSRKLSQTDDTRKDVFGANEILYFRNLAEIEFIRCARHETHTLKHNAVDVRIEGEVSAAMSSSAGSTTSSLTSGATNSTGSSAISSVTSSGIESVSSEFHRARSATPRPQRDKKTLWKKVGAILKHKKTPAQASEKSGPESPSSRPKFDEAVKYFFENPVYEVEKWQIVLADEVQTSLVNWLHTTGHASSKKKTQQERIDDFLQDDVYPSFFKSLSGEDEHQVLRSTKKPDTKEGGGSGTHLNLLLEVSLSNVAIMLLDAPRAYVAGKWREMSVKLPSYSGLLWDGNNRSSHGSTLSDQKVSGWDRLKGRWPRLLTMLEKGCRKRICRVRLQGLYAKVKTDVGDVEKLSVTASLQTFGVNDLTSTTQWPTVIACRPSQDGTPDSAHCVVNVSIKDGIAYVEMHTRRVLFIYTRFVSSLIALMTPQSKSGKLDLAREENEPMRKKLEETLRKPFNDIWAILVPNLGVQLNISCVDAHGVIPEESNLDIPARARFGPHFLRPLQEQPIVAEADVREVNVQVNLVKAEAKRPVSLFDDVNHHSAHHLDDAPQIIRVENANRSNSLRKTLDRTLTVEMYDYIRIELRGIRAHICRKLEYKNRQVEKNPLDYLIAEPFDMILELWKCIRYKGQSVKISLPDRIIARISCQQFRMLLAVVQSIQTGLKNARNSSINQWMMRASMPALYGSEPTMLQPVAVFPRQGIEVGVYNGGTELLGVFAGTCEVGIVARGKEIKIQIPLENTHLCAFNAALQEWEPLVEHVVGKLSIDLGTKRRKNGEVTEICNTRDVVVVSNPRKGHKALTLNLNVQIAKSVTALAKDWQRATKFWDRDPTPCMTTIRYQVRNETGVPITVSLPQKWSATFPFSERLLDGQSAVLPVGPWGHGPTRFSRFDPQADPYRPEVQVRFDPAHPALCWVRIDRDGLYVVPYTLGDEQRDLNVLVSTTSTESSKCTLVCIRSSCSVYNKTGTSLELTFSAQGPDACAVTVETDSSTSIPISMSDACSIRFRPVGLSHPFESTAPINFSKPGRLRYDADSLHCSGPNRRFFAVLEYTHINNYVHLPGRPHCQYPPLEIRLLAPLVVENILPVPIEYRVFDPQNFNGTAQEGKLAPGAEAMYCLSKPRDNTHISLRLAGEVAWSEPKIVMGRREKPYIIEVPCSGLGSKTGRHLVFYDHKSNPDHHHSPNKAHKFSSERIFRLTLYSPVWLINLTGVSLHIRAHSDQRCGFVELDLPSTDYTDTGFGLGVPSSAMISYGRVGVSNAAGSAVPFAIGKDSVSGIIRIKSESPCYEFAYEYTKATEKRLKKRTRVLRILPRYMLINKVDDAAALEFSYVVSGSEIGLIRPAASYPIYWSALDMQKRLRIRVVNPNDPLCWSGFFEVTPGVTLLKLRRMKDMLRFRVIRVHVFRKGPCCHICFTDENETRSTVRIKNMLRKFPIRYRQEGYDLYDVLPAKETAAFGWDEPLGSNRLQIVLSIPTGNDGPDLQLSGLYDLAKDQKKVVLHKGSSQCPPVMLSSHTDAKSSKVLVIFSGIDTEEYWSPRIHETVTVSVPDVGVSLCDDTPRELLFLALDHFYFTYDKWGERKQVDAKVGCLQIDNVLSMRNSTHPPFPVLLSFNHNPFPMLPPSPISRRFVFQFFMEQTATKQRTIIPAKPPPTEPSTADLRVKAINALSASVEPMTVCVDWPTILYLTSFALRAMDQWNSRPEKMLLTEWICKQQTPPNEDQPRFFVQSFNLPSITLHVSYESGGTENQPTILPNDVMKFFGVVPMNLHQAPVEFKPFSLNTFTGASKDLAKQIRLHYQDNLSLILQVLGAIGSLEELGAPAARFRHFVQSHRNSQPTFDSPSSPSRKLPIDDVLAEETVISPTSSGGMVSHSFNSSLASPTAAADHEFPDDLPFETPATTIRRRDSDSSCGDSTVPSRKSIEYSPKIPSLHSQPHLARRSTPSPSPLEHESRHRRSSEFDNRRQSEAGSDLHITVTPPIVVPTSTSPSHDDHDRDTERDNMPGSCLNVRHSFRRWSHGDVHENPADSTCVAGTSCQGASSKFARGSAVVLAGSLYAPLQLTSSLTKSFSKGFDALCIDDEYSRTRKAERKELARNALDGLVLGGKFLGLGVVRGLTGVVWDPVRGAKMGGMPGFWKGMATGILGLGAKPVSGAFDFVAKTTEGLCNAITPGDSLLVPLENLQAIRYPRGFSSGRTLIPFNNEHACILRDLRLCLSKKVRDELDCVMVREVCGRANESVLVATHSHIILLTPREKTSKALMTLKTVLIASTSSTARMTPSWTYGLEDIEDVIGPSYKDRSAPRRPIVQISLRQGVQPPDLTPRKPSIPESQTLLVIPCSTVERAEIISSRILALCNNTSEWVYRS